MNKEDIKEAFAIVAPVASLCGVTEEETERVLSYFYNMRELGIPPAEATILLRRTLKYSKRIAQLAEEREENLDKIRGLRNTLAVIKEEAKHQNLSDPLNSIYVMSKQALHKYKIHDDKD